ncbi:hypothetical protein O181_050885 [Austropuccinia psidii MF-1]|uniref:Uncharacterized protein n=1 Tax=Austropuccinia psidii MF-1 TaxID=1389203 RepID=A0A9Q3DW50_9BASI|nr:hypothetical protein [Austropuccinia psidii MF-1]
MVYKDKYWEMFSQIHQGVMNSWKILKKFLKEEEVVRYSNAWTPLSSKPQITKIKSLNNKKREESKEEAPVASTSKPQASPPPQEGKKNKKNNLRKQYSQSYKIQRIQKDAMENVFKITRTLVEVKDKEEKRMRKPHFPR